MKKKTLIAFFIIVGCLWFQHSYIEEALEKEKFDRETRAGVEIAEEHVFEPENIILDDAENWGDDVEGLKLDLAEELSYECVLSIDTVDRGGKICIEPDGAVRITGIVPNQYGEFWRGVAREFPGFLDAACHERLIERLRGK
jgi:hypothetical protein